MGASKNKQAGVVVANKGAGKPKPVTKPPAKKAAGKAAAKTDKRGK